MNNFEIVSLLISLIALSFAWATFNQNNKMIEESTRPNVIFYAKTIYIGEHAQYLVLKNFGQSGAKITKFDITPPLKTYAYEIENLSPFTKIEGAYIAPGQSYVCMIFENKVKNNENTIQCNIEYFSDSNNKYTFANSIKLDANHGNFANTIAKHIDSDKAVVHFLQQITENEL
jgi:hypothetical protein